MTTLKHHCATILPFYRKNDDIYFLLEQKDPKFRPPYFENGLNFLGGNWLKDKDNSPLDILAREISEEFYLTNEPEESLNELLGQEFLKDESKRALVVASHTKERLGRVQQLGGSLLTQVTYAMSFVVTVRPPISKGDNLEYGASIFLKELSENEFSGMEALLSEFDGKVSTDNLKFGGKTVLVSLNDINTSNRKFSWGYDHIVNALVDNGYLPSHKDGVLRPLKLVSVDGLGTSNCECDSNGVPTFAGLKALYTYA